MIIYNIPYQVEHGVYRVIKGRFTLGTTTTISINSGGIREV